ncbi:MAG: hypothetical protein C4290_13640 [Chloroflexota bacterium]
MTRDALLRRIALDPNIGGGVACIRGTRVPVSVILDALAEGLTPDEVLDHFPHLQIEDIHAALAYAAELAEQRVTKAGSSS